MSDQSTDPLDQNDDIVELDDPEFTLEGVVGGARRLGDVFDEDIVDADVVSEDDAPDEDA